MTSTNGLSPVHSPVASDFTWEQAAVAATSASTVIVSRNRGMQRVTNTLPSNLRTSDRMDEKIVFLYIPFSVVRTSPAARAGR